MAEVCAELTNRAHSIIPSLESPEWSTCLLSTMLREALCHDRSHSSLLSLIDHLANDTFVRESDCRRSMVDVLVGLDEVHRHTWLQSGIERLSVTVVEDRIPTFVVVIVGSVQFIHLDDQHIVECRKESRWSQTQWNLLSLGIYLEETRRSVSDVYSLRFEMSAIDRSQRFLVSRPRSADAIHLRQGNDSLSTRQIHRIHSRRISWLRSSREHSKSSSRRRWDTADDHQQGTDRFRLFHLVATQSASDSLYLRWTTIDWFDRIEWSSSTRGRIQSNYLLHCTIDELDRVGGTWRTDHSRRVCLCSSERFISVMETIHSILLVLNDDDDQTKSTRISLLEQLGQSSRSIVSMIDSTSNHGNELDLVGSRHFCVSWNHWLF